MLNSNARPAAFTISNSRFFPVSSGGSAWPGHSQRRRHAEQRPVHDLLDFGSGVFNGAPYWLEIGVRTNGTGAFITLTNRNPYVHTLCYLCEHVLERRQRFGGQEPQRFEGRGDSNGRSEYYDLTNGNNLTFSRWRPR